MSFVYFQEYPVGSFPIAVLRPTGQFEWNLSTVRHLVVTAQTTQHLPVGLESLVDEQGITIPSTINVHDLVMASSYDRPVLFRRAIQTSDDPRIIMANQLAILTHIQELTAFAARRGFRSRSASLNSNAAVGHIRGNESLSSNNSIQAGENDSAPNSGRNSFETEHSVD